jgi:hypothetical protein
MNFLMKWLFGPTSQFTCGETVQERDGHRLMTVVKIHARRNMHEPILFCQWIEKSKIHRSNIFPEHALKAHITLANHSVRKSNSLALGVARW